MTERVNVVWDQRQCSVRSMGVMGEWGVLRVSEECYEWVCSEDWEAGALEAMICVL